MAKPKITSPDDPRQSFELKKLRFKLRNARAQKERTAAALQAAWDADNAAADIVADLEAHIAAIAQVESTVLS